MGWKRRSPTKEYFILQVVWPHGRDQGAVGADHQLICRARGREVARQRLAAANVVVFAHTNRFLPRTSNIVRSWSSFPWPRPTSESRLNPSERYGADLSAGVTSHKAGVMLLELYSADDVQASLFDAPIAPGRSS
jgi:hypothetical protein